MIDLSQLGLDDTRAKWRAELLRSSDTSSPGPNAALLAVLETHAASEFGVSLVQEAVDQAEGHPITAGMKKWNPDLHPRGKDGRFIEVGGWVRAFLELFDGDSDGLSKGRVAKVKKIVPDPDTPGHPKIHVELKDADGNVVSKVVDKDVLKDASSVKATLPVDMSDVDVPDADAPEVDGVPLGPDDYDDFEATSNVKADFISDGDVIRLPSGEPFAVGRVSKTEDGDGVAFIGVDGSRVARKKTDTVTVLLPSGSSDSSAIDAVNAGTPADDAPSVETLSAPAVGDKVAKPGHLGNNWTSIKDADGVLIEEIRNSKRGILAKIKQEDDGTWSASTMFADGDGKVSPADVGSFPDAESAKSAVHQAALDHYGPDFKSRPSGGGFEFRDADGNVVGKSSKNPDASFGDSDSWLITDADGNVIGSSMTGSDAADVFRNKMGEKYRASAADADVPAADADPPEFTERLKALDDKLAESKLSANYADDYGAYSKGQSAAEAAYADGLKKLYEDFPEVKKKRDAEAAAKRDAARAEEDARRNARNAEILEARAAKVDAMPKVPAKRDRVNLDPDREYELEDGTTSKMRLAFVEGIDEDGNLRIMARDNKGYLRSLKPLPVDEFERDRTDINGTWTPKKSDGGSDFTSRVNRFSDDPEELANRLDAVTDDALTALENDPAASPEVLAEVAAQRAKRGADAGGDGPADGGNGPGSPFDDPDLTREYDDTVNEITQLIKDNPDFTEDEVFDSFFDGNDSVSPEVKDALSADMFYGVGDAGDAGGDGPADGGNGPAQDFTQLRKVDPLGLRPGDTIVDPDTGNEMVIARRSGKPDGTVEFRDADGNLISIDSNNVTEVDAISSYEPPASNPFSKGDKVDVAMADGTVKPGTLNAWSRTGKGSVVFDDGGAQTVSADMLSAPGDADATSSDGPSAPDAPDDTTDFTEDELGDFGRAALDTNAAGADWDGWTDEELIAAKNGIDEGYATPADFNAFNEDNAAAWDDNANATTDAIDAELARRASNPDDLVEGGDDADVWKSERSETGTIQGARVEDDGRVMDPGRGMFEGTETEIGTLSSSGDDAKPVLATDANGNTTKHANAKDAVQELRRGANESSLDTGPPSVVEGGEQADSIPAEFNKLDDQRWILPDGDWADYDQTDGTITRMDGNTGEVVWSKPADELVDADRGPRLLDGADGETADNPIDVTPDTGPASAKEVLDSGGDAKAVRAALRAEHPDWSTKQVATVANKMVADRDANGPDDAPGGGVTAPDGDVPGGNAPAGAAAAAKELPTADLPVDAIGKALNGQPVSKGTRVKSVRDGFEGEVVGWPDQDKYPGSVYVLGDDGKRKARNLRTLKAGDAPAAGSDGPAVNSKKPEALPAPADGLPSSANGWKTTSPSYSSEEVEISSLPTGAEVKFDGKFRKVGAPVLIDGGDPDDPDDYRFKWWDGYQWDWVDGEATFKTGYVPQDKKLHSRGQAYLNARRKAQAGSAPSTAKPPTKPTPVALKDSQYNVDEALRDSGNSYKASDPTIVSRLRKALDEDYPNWRSGDYTNKYGDDGVFIKPPSGYEVTVPLADAVNIVMAASPGGSAL